MSDVKLSEYQWERIHLFLKGCPNIYVGQEKECRNFLDAVFWITRSGSRVAFIARQLRQLEHDIQTLFAVVTGRCL